MTIAAIKRRVRTLEERRAAMGVSDDVGPWLFVCGRDEGAIREARAAHPDAPATYVPVLWTAAEPVPPPCWGDAGSLPDAILVAIANHPGAEDAAEPDRSRRVNGKRLTDLSDDQLMAIVAAPAISRRVLR